jgi:uncharacterized zinc-type alcohol dehydrogenase-like protein
MVIALAAKSPKGSLERFEFEAGPLGADEVEVNVKACGICHSDLSMLDNDWGMAKYPFVPGHEASGTIAAVGSDVKHLKVGQTVGVGWSSASCLTCTQCMSGDHNMCSTVQGTIVGRHGGFATKLRCQAAWAIPIPDALDVTTVGPMFCGGVTVFNPMVQFDVQPTDRVGVVGIGGLGHMALQFLNKWGCEVYAFTSSDSKRDEAKKMGAHEVVNSTDSKQLEKIKGRLDFIIVTVNVTLDWATYLNCLSPRGRLHFVGAVLEPLNVQAFPLIFAQRSISGSPTGSPVTIAKMLEFCARHKIAPITEKFAMSKANDAIAHLRAGKARYRIVLENDLK